jgi:hypothetical protein
MASSDVSTVDMYAVRVAAMGMYQMNFKEVYDYKVIPLQIVTAKLVNHLLDWIENKTEYSVDNNDIHVILLLISIINIDSGIDSKGST